MITFNATDIMKSLVTKTEKGNWKVGNRYMDNPETDEGELYLFQSTWLESLYWNRDTRTATVYFQKFTTNGKEPVILFNVDGRIIRRFREADSPGRFYLKQFSIRGTGNHISMNSEVFEAAIRELKGYLPIVFSQYLSNIKTLTSIFKNPSLSAARYIGNIVRNTFQSLGYTTVGGGATLVNISLADKKKAISVLQAHFSQQEIKDIVALSNKKALSKATFNPSIFFKGLQKLFLPISILSFVVGLPITISNQVKNNLKAIGVAEARANAVSLKNVDFLRRTTELKTKLLIGTSFSNPRRVVKDLTIKPLQKYKTKLPSLSLTDPLVNKVKETKKMIYSENKQIVKIKTRVDNVKTTKQKNNKVVKKLKTYKTY